MLLNTKLSELKESWRFIEALRGATLVDSDLDDESINRLKNPIEEQLAINDRDIRLSIDLYLALDDASQDTYGTVRTAILHRYPDSAILSFDQVRRRVAELSGVMPIDNDMCVKGCIAFTGPFSNEEVCPRPNCREPRYDQTILQASNGTKKVPRKKFQTIPIGPQLQASYRHPESAKKMYHRAERTAERLASGQPEVYDDFTAGSDYLAAVRNGQIRENDIALMFSIDGAQLYEKKQSDCWIYIWVILNYAPDLRYKKKYVAPGAFIPGPHKPKHIESFLLPGLQHLSALQKEGLQIWDANRNETFTSYPFLLLATADGPAMADMNGLVGHHGKAGCRQYCGLNGRHKERGGTHYYPALTKPIDNYHVSGSDHPDVNIYTIKTHKSSELYQKHLAVVTASITDAQFRERRRETGIAKPSIFLGLPAEHILGLPKCFPLDIMHLISLNLSDLLLHLWRGTLQCDRDFDNVESWDWAMLQGETWRLHGAIVENTRIFLPTSFDRAPRNPAEKINSKYKAWEFLNYVYALGPGLFQGILPEPYFSNFCKLVQGLRIVQQHIITASQLIEAHRLLLEFVRDFEIIYYQAKKGRLHFVRQSIHTLLHLVPETFRIGPLGDCSQWTMERMIGSLGREIKNHSSPYSNLSERGVRRCRVNSLKVMIPDLEPDESKLPYKSQDLGDGYVLLRALDQHPYNPTQVEIRALQAYLASVQDSSNDFRIHRWARLQLPIGQTARSAWKETIQKRAARMSRNVKVRLSNYILASPTKFTDC